MPSIPDVMALHSCAQVLGLWDVMGLNGGGWGKVW